MKNLYFFVISFVFLLINGFNTVSFAQRCSKFHKEHCPTAENIYYKYHERSRSALFVRGQTSQMYIEVFNGRDYRISVCAEDIFGNTIEFKLIDRYEGTVLYDNTRDNLAQEFEFTVTKTRELIIEIHVPDDSGHSQGEHGRDGLVRKDYDMGCVGVLIEHMITPKKGF